MTHPTKRIDLNNWLHLHDLDVVCLQEWYIPKQKDVDENDNYDRNGNENINYDSKVNNFGFESLSISLDMSLITGYKKIEHDNKTIILYKTDLHITTFNHFNKISQNGLDIFWIGIVTHRKIIVVGSRYHSSNFNCTYEQIIQQKNKIKKNSRFKNIQQKNKIKKEFKI